MSEKTKPQVTAQMTIIPWKQCRKVREKGSAACFL